jgi:hypothetical protein
VGGSGGSGGSNSLLDDDDDDDDNGQAMQTVTDASSGGARRTSRHALASMSLLHRIGTIGLGCFVVLYAVALFVLVCGVLVFRDGTQSSFGGTLR